MAESILGVWDGHDSGAALIEGKKILFASNEEKYNNLKLWAGWPKASIIRALSFSAEPTTLAYSTSDLSKATQRLFPSTRESYYYFRRRLKKANFAESRRRFKYATEHISFSRQLKPLNNQLIASFASKQGIQTMGKPSCVEHHLAHAAGGIFTSGLDKALVVTYDGVGDGICSSVRIWENGQMRKLLEIGARDSVAIFYEQATTLAGFRELEDEGKLMALADYYTPKEGEKEQFSGFFKTEGLALRAKRSPLQIYSALKKFRQSATLERFAYHVQLTAEQALLQYVEALSRQYPSDNLILSGGFFSNIKANKLIRERLNFKHIYVYPNMGDGGLALGSALFLNYQKNGITNYSNVKGNQFLNLLGDEIDTQAYRGLLVKAAKDKGINVEVEQSKDTASLAADLIAGGEILLYAQGRTEFGPRALGNRSILALPNSIEIKDKLNKAIKGREWFMPFAPSMLESEAAKYIQGPDMPNYHMTQAYDILPGRKRDMLGVINVDDTCRPQYVNENNGHYHKILQQVKKKTGLGLVLNTSFNLHGYPIVNNMEQAINVLLNSKTEHMIINNLHFIKNS